MSKFTSTAFGRKVGAGLKATGANTSKPIAQKKEEKKGADAVEGHDEWLHGKPLIKPLDQVELTETELEEEITRTLSANNPHAPQNIVRYSYKELAFKPVTVDHLEVHFVLEGNLMYLEASQEYRLSEALHEDTTIVETGAQPDEERAKIQETPTTDEEEVDEGGEEDRPDSEASKTDKKEPKLKNQFSFCERASQTLTNPLRERGCQTEPPPCRTFCATANQSEIYDAYVEWLQAQEKNKEKQKGVQSKRDDSSKRTVLMESQTDELPRLTKAAKILERMVNQNTFDYIAQDFKYYEDPSDEFRDQKGTLLPLWKFQCDKAKGMSVTALCWNKKYQDLFAVGMGTYDFCKQGPGVLVFHTLKNHSFPEYIYTATSGIMCVDIHQQHSYLVAVGFYDGHVAVYNLKKRGEGEPVYKSTAKMGKHTDPVWEVRWQKDDLDGNRNFCSISSDGRIVSWTLVKNELIFTDILRLSVTVSVSDVQGGGQQVSVDVSGTSFDFHKQIDHLFLVGTEDGKIHKCSKTYSNQLLKSYDAHNMAVDAVKWNHFHSGVFISCSSDWTVKVWDHAAHTPLFIFDLHAPVGDVAWAPYSSTVFAAVTLDGIVHVFDLNLNKFEALCQQAVVANTVKLTHIEFNPIYPIIIVGDERGFVTSLKLSPNLRKRPKDKKGQVLPNVVELEIANMEKLVHQQREPEKNTV
ncbi:dynein, axonemal, intermediate chain 1, paralog 2 [Takifugu rubripes]|uniref:Dynein axonemal intermediate chain 1 n=1 Tax=Takifugu rubripes TaxID=31033 RepID=H2USG9_TAKRU|nr:dynein intermediate chain 1, axonemal [Takifugu rubripes]